MSSIASSPLSGYQHDHPEVMDVNAAHDSRRSIGQVVADKVANVVGSWPFIITQSILLTTWIVANVYFVLHPGAFKAFDPYPFILLNLALSFQAAYTGPIVMMSQNRQSEKDRLMAQNDFQCNVTAETEIRLLMEHLLHQDEIMAQMMNRIDQLSAQLDAGKK